MIIKTHSTIRTRSLFRMNKIMRKTKIYTQAMTMALVLITVGFNSGCGGGPIHTGGLGIFSPKKLQDQVIQIDALPSRVRPLVEAETANSTIKEITKGVRETDGKYYYTITYTDQSGVLTTIRYWHDGTIIFKERQSIE